MMISCELCNKKAVARRLCMAHYKKAVKNGSLDQFKKVNPVAVNALSLISKRFGDLVVVEKLPSSLHQKTRWLCICDCGNKIETDGSMLNTGRKDSCGCKEFLRRSKARATHGMDGTRAHRIWSAMKTRCSNKNIPNYMNYGGRGISVCQRWKNSFENFLADMGHPSDFESIDRIDNNGNYEPGNCRWATRAEQSQNTRANRVIEYKGERLVLKQWANRIGIDQASLRERLDKWPLEIALTKPPKKGKNNVVSQ